MLQVMKQRATATDRQSLKRLDNRAYLLGTNVSHRVRTPSSLDATAERTLVIAFRTHTNSLCAR
jgi:hypothetical protein